MERQEGSSGRMVKRKESKEEEEEEEDSRNKSCMEKEKSRNDSAWDQYSLEVPFLEEQKVRGHRRKRPQLCLWNEQKDQRREELHRLVVVQ
jgi:hypothetical protein